MSNKLVPAHHDSYQNPYSFSSAAFLDPSFLMQVNDCSYKASRSDICNNVVQSYFEPQTDYTINYFISELLPPVKPAQRENVVDSGKDEVDSGKDEVNSGNDEVDFSIFRKNKKALTNIVLYQQVETEIEKNLMSEFDSLSDRIGLNLLKGKNSIDFKFNLKLDEKDTTYTIDCDIDLLKNSFKSVRIYFKTFAKYNNLLAINEKIKTFRPLTSLSKIAVARGTEDIHNVNQYRARLFHELVEISAISSPFRSKESKISQVFKKNNTVQISYYN